MASWQELGGPARRIGAAIGQAVQAAGTRDLPAYETAVASLAGRAAEYSGLVLGALVRSLLEEQHPDGLDSDDIQAVLSRCYRDALRWLPADRVDAHTLLAVLASALGIHEPGVTYEEIVQPVPAGQHDDWAGDPVQVRTYGADPESGRAASPAPSQVPTAAGYAWHAPLLIADLVTAGGRPLGGHLDAAFTEIARAETMEQP